MGNCEEIEHGVNMFSSGMFPCDIAVRALEIMAGYFPNLTMYRGTSFYPDNLQFTGVDFAPGGLATALEFAERSYGGPRTDPVIVSITFTDVVNQYVQNRMSVSTENNWWRGCC